MKQLSLFIFLLVVCSSTLAQVERFPSGDRTTSGNFPIIDGYEAGEPDSIFHQALDEYIIEMLEKYYDEDFVFVNGVAEFILKVEGTTVTGVEFIESNSTLFNRYLIPILHSLEIEEGTDGPALIHHRIVQPIRCCERREEVIQDSSLNALFMAPLLFNGHYTEELLRWKVYVDDGELQCIIPSMNMEATWTDVLIEEISFIESEEILHNLEDGAYLVQVPFELIPTFMQIKAFQTALKLQYTNDLSSSLRVLNNWLRYSGQTEFNSARPVDTVIAIDRAQFPSSYYEGDRWIAAIDHEGRAVFSVIDRGGSLRIKNPPTGIIYEHLLTEYEPEDRKTLFKVMEADRLAPVFVELIPTTE